MHTYHRKKYFIVRKPCMQEALKEGWRGSPESVEM